MAGRQSRFLQLIIRILLLILVDFLNVVGLGVTASEARVALITKNCGSDVNNHHDILTLISRIVPWRNCACGSQGSTSRHGADGGWCSLMALLDERVAFDEDEREVNKAPRGCGDGKTTLETVVILHNQVGKVGVVNRQSLAGWYAVRRRRRLG